MKRLTLFLSSLAFSATACAADAPRLMLWVTDSISATNGAHCRLAELPAPTLPALQPSVTEQDVTAWDPLSARWTLNPARFAVAAAAHTLQDHCFVLAIDGKFVSSGVLLSEHSARLIDFPTISVSTQDNVLSLQLNSSHRGGHRRPIHVDALNGVLGQRPVPTQATNR